LVFADSNGSGVLDSMETGLAGFTVKLYGIVGGKASSLDGHHGFGR